MFLRCPSDSIRSQGGLFVLAMAFALRWASATELPDTAAERGYYWLTEKAYLPPDFDQETFEHVWEVWPTRLRELARVATPEVRRQMAFERYGLSTRPDDTSGRPLQYVVSESGQWTMNCLACHGGQVNGQSIPGLPNANFELETLTEEIRQVKLRQRKPLARMEIGSLVMPLGANKGLTNAVMFGVALMSYRDADLNVVRDRPRAKMVHHDMDPPAWWNFRKRTQIYIDGYAEKNVRSLMQFMLVLENGPEQFHAWERDFEDVFAYLESLRPPKFPFPINRALARRGQSLFDANCAKCHGTYGEKQSYPGRVVPIDEIGTDPVRLTALQPADRKAYGASWFGEYGKTNNIDSPPGYVAPPLDGIWASAPYFHNGAVPTLWDVLHPADRPTAWQRISGGRPADYDSEKVGLAVERLEKMPAARMSRRLRRLYFDSQQIGKDNAGHDYPDVLDEPEKRAVLEYLKSL